MKLYEAVSINQDGNTEIPVSGVVYHPIAENRLKRGEPAEPMFCIRELEYDSILSMLTEALGWQGGTIHEVVDEIKRLKSQPNPRE